MKILILCADDYAVHEAASRGIVHLARRARLSATSVMSLSGRWSEDAAPLKELRGQIDVGLHLDWTSEFAIAAGHGASLNAIMVRALLGQLSQAKARMVIERQLDAFEQHWQGKPDHVDGHQHVQQFAGIRQALVEVLKQRYGLSAPYVRISRVPASQRNFKSRVIAAMGAQALEELARTAGIATAPTLSGVYDFSGGQQPYPARMRQWLASTERGIIMCHPADGPPADDAIAPARQWEFDYLAKDGFAHDLANAGVRLGRGPG